VLAKRFDCSRDAFILARLMVDHTAKIFYKNGCQVNLELMAHASRCVGKYRRNKNTAYISVKGAERKLASGVPDGRKCSGKLLFVSQGMEECGPIDDWIPPF